jgi:hypothetical protein
MERSGSRCVVVGLAFRLDVPTCSFRNTSGLPSSRCTSMHMPRLENPADSPHPHQGGCFTWTSSTLQPSSVGTKAFSGRCQHVRITVIPVAYAFLCGPKTLRGAGSTLHRFCSQCAYARRIHYGDFPKHCSATGATLDTGGWLALSRQGLPPCKVHQASLGALTLSCAAPPSRPQETARYLRRRHEQRVMCFHPIPLMKRS